MGCIVIVADGTITEKSVEVANGTPILWPPPNTKETFGFFIPCISSDKANPASTSPPIVLSMMNIPSILGS